MKQIDIIEGLLYIAGDNGLSEESLIMNVPITKLQLAEAVQSYEKDHFVIEKMGINTSLKQVSQWRNTLNAF